jgi:hypothetical protein
MRGRSIPLSVPRRLVVDFLRLAVTIPSVPIERVMDLSAVIVARNACSPRPPWAGILAKACAITGRQLPEARRAYLNWPWPHLYEYPTSVIGITIDRAYNGEPCVLVRLIKDPAAFSINEITQILRHAKRTPLNELRDFRRALTISRLPGILRRPLWWLAHNIGRQRANYFGTFLITDIAIAGLDSTHPLAPTSLVLTRGPFGPDGRVLIRLVADHRVADGVSGAKFMKRMETVLNGPIVEELRAQAGNAGPAVLPG